MTVAETIETYVDMPDAVLPSAVPHGWTISEENLLTIVGPEQDLHVTFIAMPRDSDNADLVRNAWNLIRPGFKLPIRQEVEAPSNDGWDSTYQIVYDSAGSEGQMALAVVRTLGNHSYVNLVQGTKAAFSRRGAQIGEIIKLWKPVGLTEHSLAGVAPRTFGEEEKRAVSSFVEAAMRKLQVPGVSIAIVQAGQTVYAEGFGVRTAGEDSLVTPSTRFMIGSSTKPLTTLMMARLVDMGHFDWSTPVTDVLPGFSLADLEMTSKLQMRHTISASTGMPRRDFDLAFRFKGVRPEDRIAEMKRMLPTTAFGETFQYSNYLVAAGGYAAAHAYSPERGLNDAYIDAMQTLVFEPLFMKDTSVHSRGGENASPHARDMDGTAQRIDIVLEGFADAVAPAGSAWSTAIDMAEYVRCELNGGVNSSGHPVASVENLLLRRQPGIKLDEKRSYGLGLFVTQEQGLSVISHGGNTIGFSSDMFFLPEHGIGVVVLTNRGMANSFLMALHQKILDLLFEVPVRKAEAMIAAACVSSEKLSERLSRTVKTDGVSTDWIAGWIGEYECEELGPARISFGKAGLYIIEFESWSSSLGVGNEAPLNRELVLTSPPWRGDVRLQTEESTRVLVLDGGQTKYTFTKVKR